MTTEDHDLIPKAKRQAAQTWRGDRIYLSGDARGSLEHLKQHLREHPAWLNRLSNSTIIEFLCEYWLSGGKLTIASFKACTPSPGRPRGQFTIDNLRPSHVRKAAGLTKDDATLGPKLDGG